MDGFETMVRGRASGVRSASTAITATLAARGHARQLTLSSHADALLGTPAYVEFLTDAERGRFALRAKRTAGTTSYKVTRTSTAIVTGSQLANALGIPRGERVRWTGRLENGALIFESPNRLS